MIGDEALSAFRGWMCGQVVEVLYLAIVSTHDTLVLLGARGTNDSEQWYPLPVVRSLSC